jgi:hypothetical protein
MTSWGVTVMTMRKKEQVGWPIVKRGLGDAIHSIP